MPDFYYFGASKMGWFFNYFGINDPMLLNSGKNALTQQSNGIVKTVSTGGWWSLTNIAAYNISFSCNFFGTKSYVRSIDRVGCWKDDRGSNNTQNVEMAVRNWYMHQSTTNSFMNLCQRYRCWFSYGICTHDMCMYKSTAFHWKW
jgi:hypothetical protein